VQNYKILSTFAKQTAILIQKSMGKSNFIQEFKAFAMKGNVVDMAVGVIIGGAFGKIVSSVVADVVMPPLGLLIGGVNFTDLKLTLKDAVPATETTEAVEAVTLNYGNFLQNVFDFLIIALAIFLLIKGITKLTTKKQAEEPAPEPPAPSKEEVLLTEIRDLLKEQKK
jgi:large conductance mechanosensitive channel